MASVFHLTQAGNACLDDRSRGYGRGESSGVYAKHRLKKHQVKLYDRQSQWQAGALLVYGSPVEQLRRTLDC